VAEVIKISAVWEESVLETVVFDSRTSSGENGDTNCKDIDIVTFCHDAMIMAKPAAN